MNVYLIRHSQAEQTSEGKLHEERALTLTGIEILRDSIEFWKNFIASFNIILSSPLKRAKQTAQIIQGTFNTEFDVVEEICLINGGLTEDLISIARSLSMNDIAMVGHQPDIGNHLSTMIGTNLSNFHFPPAAIAKISFNDKPKIGNGVCEFLLPPIIKNG